MKLNFPALIPTLILLSTAVCQEQKEGGNNSAGDILDKVGDMGKDFAGKNQDLINQGKDLVNDNKDLVDKGKGIVNDIINPDQNKSTATTATGSVSEPNKATTKAPTAITSVETTVTDKETGATKSLTKVPTSTPTPDTKDQKDVTSLTISVTKSASTVKVNGTTTAKSKDSTGSGAFDSSANISLKTSATLVVALFVAYINI